MRKRFIARLALGLVVASLSAGTTACYDREECEKLAKDMPAARERLEHASGEERQKIEEYIAQMERDGKEAECGSIGS